MKHLKTYENTQDEPQIGDYVRCDERLSSPSRKFTLNKIGQYLRRHTFATAQFLIQYENVPEHLMKIFTEDNCRNMTRDEIIFFSPNKKDCEIYIDVNKYNL